MQGYGCNARLHPSDLSTFAALSLDPRHLLFWQERGRGVEYMKVTRDPFDVFGSEFCMNDFEVVHRIDSILHVCDVWIFKRSTDVHNAVHRLDIRKESVSQSLSFCCASETATGFPAYMRTQLPYRTRPAMSTTSRKAGTWLLGLYRSTSQLNRSSGTFTRACEDVRWVRRVWIGMRNCVRLDGAEREVFSGNGDFAYGIEEGALAHVWQTDDTDLRGDADGFKG